jgi:hypothetical protein
MCSFRSNKWFSIQRESCWPLQVRRRSLWLSFHVRPIRERFRRLLNAGNTVLFTPRELWLILFVIVTVPSKLAPIIILVEMHLGVLKSIGILGELEVPLSSF